MSSTIRQRCIPVYDCEVLVPRFRQSGFGAVGQNGRGTCSQLQGGQSVYGSKILVLNADFRPALQGYPESTLAR